MNWLFLAFLGTVGVGVVATKRRLSGGDGDEPRSGPVPGYTVTDGSAFALDPMPDDLERGVDWWPELVEEFHSRDRARIVLRFGVRKSVSARDVEELIRSSAREVAQRSNAHVVYVEGHSDGELRGAYLWAPDGRGWSGQDPTSEVCFPGDS